MSTESDLAQAFIEIVAGRNFVAFEELETKLRTSRSELIRLKGKLEDALRQHEHSHIHLTSRLEVDPPGFEIGE